MKPDNSCPQESPTYYKIGMFASMNRVTIKALRHYDEQDLLKPIHVEEDNGYRYYASSQIADLHQILALKNMGFSLEEIRAIRRGSCERELLNKKKYQILKEISELTARLAQVESYLAQGHENESAFVLIKRLPAVKVAAMRVRLESYEDLFTYMPQMGEEMERLDCVCAQPDYCFTYYLEPGYKEEQILIETCQAVEQHFPDSDIVQYKELGEVSEAACIMHKGSYEDLPKSYTKVIQFIEENGYEISGPIRESYIDGIWNKEAEEDWLSEIQVPVCKKCR